MWSLDKANAARGRKYARVVVNEAAMIPNLEESWEQVILPTLADLSGDAWFGSTPRGRNYFWRMYQRAQDHGDVWYSHHAPTSANPYIAAEEIAQAKDELPERIFRQEFLAEFIEDGSGVFRGVDDAAVLKPEASPKDHAGHSIGFGIDWAKQEDFSVINGYCGTCRKQVVFDRFNRVDYAIQRSRVKALRDRWKPAKILAESNSIGDPIIEDLRAEGVSVEGFQTTASTKPPLIDALALALEKGEMKLFNTPIQTNELKAYEMQRGRSGAWTYGAPHGTHDDTVIALALALRSVSATGGWGW